MGDYKHHSERTLPKPVNGRNYRWPKADMDNRHGDITVTRPDGTQYIIRSEDAPQIVYEKPKKDGRSKANH